MEISPRIKAIASKVVVLGMVCIMAAGLAATLNSSENVHAQNIANVGITRVCSTLPANDWSHFTLSTGKHVVASGVDTVSAFATAIKNPAELKNVCREVKTAVLATLQHPEDLVTTKSIPGAKADNQAIIVVRELTGLSGWDARALVNSSAGQKALSDAIQATTPTLVVTPAEMGHGPIYDL